ncbi:TonB-dependent receptor [Sphingobacterium corticibacter]|uniref:TonB-dependent receptor n=1 Tax=Sphingobacterium corticibacter TaxID=2171749 RepID=A0A2T8HJ95_9SPHI|nr:TonB-dependent receptor [Sphingobacterium corticibacter]PVH25514.1 TonB-dependent receptor [Sphingobacterium corticibacter]
MHKIILTTTVFLLTLSAIYGQQKATLRGQIVDSENQPVPFATITIRETSQRFSADADGKFSVIPTEAPPFRIRAVSVGYRAAEILFENQSFEDEITLRLASENQVQEVIVTSRRRQEQLQDVPIPISVVSGKFVEESGAFNVNRIKEIVPSVQLYSSNPRNTGISIRGLGTTFGLTNDGIDPGVGFYVDGVYYARNAVTTLDFIDVEQIEVLRGPQGTLFGKNTVAGAFNITTRKPTFHSTADAEVSYGNYGFVQAKGSISGPITNKIAARLSFSGTQRDGLIYNVATQKYTNELNNLGLRGQVLYQPSDKVDVLFAGDLTRQRPDGYAQVFAGVAPTLRADYRQFENIIADLNYDLPSRNPFDRIIDHDTPWRSGQDLGGLSANVDVKLGGGTLTSTTAWRFWNWDPSNDRDFTGLQALALSQAPSRHDQWSQEVRWAGDFSSTLSAVFGVYVFGQKLDADPAHTEQAGVDQWRFAQSSTSPLWQTPGLFDGLGIRSYPSMRSFSGALFTQFDWAILPNLRLLPGLRLNYDDKSVNFRREVFGGLQTDDPALIALQNGLYSNQAFEASVDDTNLSGQVTIAYKASEKINTFATFSTGFKPVGLNLGGLPNQNGEPMLELAVIRPERVTHYEVGIKTNPTPSTQLNLTAYNTDVRDYQTQVQAADLSVNRGYLANAEKVRVRGIELDANARVQDWLSVYGSLAYTDGKYVTFTNAPPPLEGTGGPSFVDVSGGRLPGISEWATSFGAEVKSKSARFLGQRGEYFFAADGFYRSTFSSNPTPSAYLVVPGYTLVNPRIGFRSQDGVSVTVWARNIFDKNYFEQLLPGAGNAGHYAGVLGDPRTYGITLRYAWR